MAATAQPTGDLVAVAATDTRQPEAGETATASDATPEPAVVESTTTPAPSLTRLPTRPGALIAITMDSQVGVLLDEIPESMRQRVAGTLLERPDSFWQELALRQMRLTKRRLNFRNFLYNGKGQLPLPPQELWSFRLDPAGPSRQLVQGHDLVMIPYTFASTLLTDAASPGKAEPALGEIGGQWDEPFVLPLDPDLLLQRTGNACLNEAGFPPNSFDSENAWIFYDYTCQGNSGGVLGCHRTRLTSQSCLEALAGRIGMIETVVRYERLAWDSELAEEVRIGEITDANGADLKVFGEDLEDFRVVYRYFPSDSCALAESCIGDSGWRRLLQFTATVHNVGGAPLQVGPVVTENSGQSLFQYNACHAHYHFSNYGDFFLDSANLNLSSKQAFCVESTNRFSNNELSPLTHPYRCLFQGVEVGWVDEYVAGLDCQWIDITDVDLSADSPTVTLGFTSNPDEFLCEGTPVLDDEGNPVWEPSEVTDEHGEPVARPVCEFISDWDVNNVESREIALPPVGSFVTEPCRDSLLGPLRNCGFREQLEGVLGLPETGSGLSQSGSGDPELEELVSPFACSPSQPVQLSCRVNDGAAAQVLRVCDFSASLDTGVACTFQDALANVVVEGSTDVSFSCPFTRDVDEPGGLYSLYSAPISDDDEPAPISCTVIQ